MNTFRWLITQQLVVDSKHYPRIKLFAANHNYNGFYYELKSTVIVNEMSA